MNYIFPIEIPIPIKRGPEPVKIKFVRRERLYLGLVAL